MADKLLQVSRHLVPMKLKLIVAFLVAAGCTLGFFLGRFCANSTWAGELERLRTLTRHVARPEVELTPSGKVPQEDFFSRFYQLEAELLAGGETNVAIKVSALSEAWLLSEYTREARHAVAYLEMTR